MKAIDLVPVASQPFLEARLVEAARPIVLLIPDSQEHVQPIYDLWQAGRITPSLMHQGGGDSISGIPVALFVLEAAPLKVRERYVQHGEWITFYKFANFVLKRDGASSARGLCDQFATERAYTTLRIRG